MNSHSHTVTISRNPNTAAGWLACRAMSATAMISISAVLTIAYPMWAQPPDGGNTTDTSIGTEGSPIGPTMPATVAGDDLLGPVSAWLDTIEIDVARRDMTLMGLSSPFDEGSLDPEIALDVLARTLAGLDDRAGELLAWCAVADARATPHGWEWLMDSSTAPLLRNNLRLYLGRWYAQRELYDEALHLLDQLDTKMVVAPAMLLFYRGVCLHQLVESERARGDVDRLLTSFHSLPQRYDAIAALLQHDLAGAKEGSLDDIARQMHDVGRRLLLGRSGSRVQGREARIVELLDRTIEELEEQQRNQQSSSSNSPNGMKPGGSPAQESQLLGGSGAGRVAPRDIGNKDGWGNLSPKQRDEALQLLGKDLPAHYRSAVEQYFRTLATQSSTEENE
jgi:hypothetical protein